MYDFGTSVWQPVFRGVGVIALAADDVAQRLYVGSVTGEFYHWNYSNLGSNTVPVQVGTFSPTVTALAWDSVAGRLYATTTANEGIYEVNPSTGGLTLVFDYVDLDYDFGGLDYNPADGKLYATNDDTSPAAIGIGLYRIDIVAQTIEPVRRPYPTFVGAGTVTTPDIDGLAVGRIGVGPPKAYFVVDEPGEVAIFNLATLSDEPPISNPWTSALNSSGGAWANALPGAGIQANVRVSITDVPDPVVPPGGTLTYTITTANLGPDTATGINLTSTLPANVNFVSAQPPGSFSAGGISANIGTLASGAQASFDVVVSTTTAGSVSYTASVTSAQPDPALSNNSATALTTVRGPQADLIVGMVEPADCSVSAGQVLSYTVTVQNLGTESATAVALTDTLPAGSIFVSSTPPSTPSSGVVSFNLGTIASGGSSVVTVNVQPPVPGSYTNFAEASAQQPDPNPSNNSTSQTTVVGPAAPPTAAAKGILSTVAGSPTSLVPGLGGVRFIAGGLGRPWKSPSGANWIMGAQTDAPASTNSVLLVGQGTTATVRVREGVTVLPTTPGGFTPAGAFDPVQAINDKGMWVFSGNDSRSDTTRNGYIARWSPGAPGQLVTVVQESLPCPAFPAGNVLYGPERGSVNILNDPSGTVSFFHTLYGSGVEEFSDTALLTNNGTSVLAQEGVTVPFGQATGTFTYKSFDPGSAAGLGFFMDSAGIDFIAAATVHASISVPATSGADRVAVLTNAVIIQENIQLASAGFQSAAADIAPFTSLTMEGHGSWFAGGSLNNSTDWVLGGIGPAFNVSALTGGDVIPGSGGETWSQTGNPATFFLACGNTLGEYIIGGTTSEANPLRNSVVALNGQRIVARENDPVDLDANGVFDDGVYIRGFLPAQGFLSDAHDLYLLVSLRGHNAAACNGPDTIDVGQALIFIDLDAQPPSPCGSADFDGDGDTGTDLDIEAFFACLGGDCCGTCGSADFDGDGDTGTDLDIEAFFRVLGGGEC